MGGDQGPSAVIAGLFICADAHSDIHFLAHGNEAQLRPLLAKRRDLIARITLVHAPRVVTMLDKPSQVMRHGEGTSMWSTIDSLKSGRAVVAVSCGNTGANALDLTRPRVGILNVGTEEHKGSAELKLAQDLLQANATLGDYEYIGFVEGSDIPSDRVDVIVTDGFTGNIALKTGEGTARLVSDFLRLTLTSTIWAKLGYLLARRAFGRLREKMDPRSVNGGVFLGLNGTVVKSHGGADETGVAAAIGLAIRLARAGFLERLSARIASVSSAGHGAAGSTA